MAWHVFFHHLRSFGSFNQPVVRLSFNKGDSNIAVRPMFVS